MRAEKKTNIPKPNLYCWPTNHFVPNIRIMMNGFYMSSICRQRSQNNLYLQPTEISREKEERTTNVRNIKNQSLWLKTHDAIARALRYLSMALFSSLFLSRVRCLLDPNWNTVHMSQTITRHTLHTHFKSNVNARQQMENELLYSGWFDIWIIWF